MKIRNLPIIFVAWLISLLAVPPAEADVMCKWFGYCVYESPAFNITVMDKETGKPVADVHALAEWVQYASHGTNGPVVALDALSGSDGVLTFPAWGPVRGSTVGLVLNQDPVISLFKPGYKVLIINNHPGRDERARVRGFTQHGGTVFHLEPFRGTPNEWVEQLAKVWLGHATPRGDEQNIQFRGPYLNRLRRVWVERDNAPPQYHKPGQFFWHVEREIRFYEEGKR